jgi:hypothetical protein
MRLISRRARQRAGSPAQLVVTIAALVVLGVVALKEAPRAADPLDVRVSPRVAHAPATLRITVQVEPESLNRSVVVAAEGEQFSRSSLIQLEGAESPRIHDVQYRGLPAGRYVIGVTLFSSTDVRAVEWRDVIVRGEGEGEGPSR